MSTGTLSLAVAIASDENDILSGPFGLDSTLKGSLSISLKYFKINICTILLKVALLTLSYVGTQTSSRHVVIHEIHSKVLAKNFGNCL